MNIGFYGHSNCAYRGKGSYIDIVANHFKAKVANIGVKQGSEERILHELKRTSKLDVAVIVHSYSSCLYLPGCDRDVALSAMTANRAEYVFKAFDRTETPKFVDRFKDGGSFYDYVLIYKRFFYDPDTQYDRFTGSALQIDQYLKSKNIATVHITERNRFPGWLKFQHGVVDENNITEDFKIHAVRQPFFANCITEEGNYIVSQKLISLIDKCGE